MVGITIGNGAHQFRGVFDGDNDQVLNLYVNRNDDAAGLFGYVGQGGVVRNGHVVDGDISGTYWCGGIADRNSNGFVENCYNRGDVYIRNRARGYGGGVVGENTASSTVDNYYSTGSVEGSLACGAIAGANGEGSTVQDCYYPR